MRISPVYRELWNTRFATNAGMFDPALKPVGLYVEQGRELVHVNTRSGYGNFHMKPNGIFNAGISQAAAPGGFGDAIRADAGDKGALASSFRPGQHLAQSAHWRWNTRRWQSHIRHLSGRGVV
jgi:hypothetical protein